MFVPQGGHGDRVEMTGDDIGVYIRGAWCVLPWTAGKTWTVAEALTRKGSRVRLLPAAGAWCQGEAYDVRPGEAARLYGVPFKKDGPSLNPDGSKKPVIPARIDWIRDGKVIRQDDLDHLARDENGVPIGGRLEPEGIAVGVLNGVRCLLVGFAINGLGKNQMSVYAKPIE